MAMLGNLGENLTKTMKKLVGMSVIDKKTIKEVVKEIQRALIQSDVNIALVLDLSKKIESRALEEEPPKGITPREYVITIIYEEMVNLLGGDAAGLDIDVKPYKILFLGLQGSGKTTTSGKLANYLRKKEAKKPLLVACDIYRPAAIDQLKTVGKELNIPVFSEDNKKVTEIVQDALTFAKENGNDYVIIDTAGRLHIDDTLMEELKDVEDLAHPDEEILVIDAMMGQDAINVINGFNNKLNLTGCILTKMDGNTKGGVALSVRHLTHVPIKFIGDSEKLDGLMTFDPERMAERILDMGDIMAIAEKVESVIDADEVEEQAAKMKKGEYDLEDFLKNLKQIKKLGPLDKFLKLLPQARQIGLNNINIDPKDMAHVEAIVLSMTKYERKHPEVLKASRKRRIAEGSGRTVEEVNRLLKQFETMQKMMKQMASGNFKMPF